MTTLHWRVIGLLAWLTFFFNIDRLSALTSQSLPPQHQTIALVGIIAALLPMLPIFESRSRLMLIGIVTLIYGVTITLGGALTMSGVIVWQLLADFILLLVTVVLSHRVAQGLQEFRRAVETLTLTAPNTSKQLRSLEDTREMVDIEMARSRRFERPLSLVMIQADASSINMNLHRIVQEVQRGMMQRYVLATMAYELSRTLRRTDLVVEDDQPGRLLLVAPETTEAEAEQMGVRIAQLIQERLGVNASYGVAAFPQQALTFEDLRNVAETHLHTNPEEVVNDDQSKELLELSLRPNVTVSESEHVRV